MLMHWWMRQKVSKMKSRAFSMKSSRQATRKKSFTRTWQGQKHQSGEHPSGFIHTRNKQKTECSTNELFLVPLCQIQGLLFSKEITTFLPRKITTLTLQCWKGAYIQSIIIPPHGSHTWCAGKYFLWFRSSATGYSNLHIKISQWKPSK